mmetsp:Transcript_13265/g.38550  ORF Transcript_13265/g.38550 Transcript_13265/m.38550 type:complete len:244 (-) Transcript_13265:264-995(-)
MPSSLARNWRSTKNGLPASAPEPNGSVATRGSRSRSRWSSRCSAAAWHIIQWPHRTVIAGCRCVKPGMSTCTSASEREHDTSSSWCSDARISSNCAYSHRRVSVATWSLRERPVCSFPPTPPMSSVRRRSFAVWMSSSPCLITNWPACHSDATLSRPPTMVSDSSAVRMPHLASALAYALLPRMSSAHMRLSNGSDSLYFSINGSIAPVKRPPHSFLGSSAAAFTAILRHWTRGKDAAGMRAR